MQSIAMIGPLVKAKAFRLTSRERIGQRVVANSFRWPCFVVIMLPVSAVNTLLDVVFGDEDWLSCHWEELDRLRDFALIIQPEDGSSLGARIEIRYGRANT